MSRASDRAYEMIRDMSDDGVGVILVADTLEEAIGLSHSIIVLKDGASLTVDELRDFLSTRLGKFQIPRYFRFSTEPLPRGATGKILKKDLRAEAAKDLAGA